MQDVLGSRLRRSSLNCATGQGINDRFHRAEILVAPQQQFLSGVAKQERGKAIDAVTPGGFQILLKRLLSRAVVQVADERR